MERSGGCIIELNAEIVEAVRRHFGFDSISLLGSSFGGMPLLEYLTKYSHHVDSAVLSCAQANTNTWQTGNIDHISEVLQRHFPERWQKLLALRAEGVRSTDDEYLELLDPAEDFVLWPNRDASQLTKSKPLDKNDNETHLARPDIRRYAVGQVRPRLTGRRPQT